MADSAALLVDEVLPHQPMRQWVLSVPFPLRFLCASQPAVMSKVKTARTPITSRIEFHGCLRFLCCVKKTGVFAYVFSGKGYVQSGPLIWNNLNFWA